MSVSQAKLDSWIRSYGTNSNSYVLLEGPKSYFTSPGVDGFLAYQVSGGVALIAGDPVCAPHQARRLIRDFASAVMRPVGAYQVSPSMLEAFRGEGFGDVQIGKDAVGASCHQQSAARRSSRHGTSSVCRGRSANQRRVRRNFPGVVAVQREQGTGVFTRHPWARAAQCQALLHRTI